MKCVRRFVCAFSGGVCSVAARLAALTVIVVAVLAVAMGMFARDARAEIDEALLQIGSNLRQLERTELERLREARINGARFWLRTHSVQAPVAQVLRRYEEVCAESNSRVFRALGHAVDGLVSRAADILGAIATSSDQQADRGYVACVDFGTSDGDLLLDRLGGLSRSGDLSAIGSVRYVYVERDVSSPVEESFVLVIRASFESLIGRLVPLGDGDADGQDVPGFPRPRDAQRVLSAWEVNGPSGLFSYVTEAHSAADLESFYRNSLPKQGWRFVERHPGESVKLDQIRMLAAEKEGRLITVITHPAAKGTTVLTILVSEPS